MIRYWKEDTETEIGKPFDLEKHDKEISDRWLAKIKQAREEIAKVYPKSIFDHDKALRTTLQIIDELISESEEK